MRLFVFSILVPLIVSRSIDELPHCSRSTVMEGEVRDFDDYRGKMKIYNAVQLSMALHETACVSLKINGSEASVLHAFEFARLEQHHPISGKYDFAIPRITPSCFCDCAGGQSRCTMEEYNYRNCTKGALCFRTYHPMQSSVGCVGSTKSEACCDIRIDPFRDWRFTAIRINQPDTVLIFRYRIYERVTRNWRLASDEVIEVPLNRGSSRFEFNNQHRIEMVVTGSRPNREIQPGMYFVRDQTHEIRGYVPINDLGENNLGKLGWLRLVNGKFEIKNGLAKIMRAHHLSVTDCKAQQYTSTIDGEQIVSVSADQEDESFDLGRPVSDDAWIQTAAVKHRTVVVEHAEGISIGVHMTTETRPYIYRHASQFASFSGTIQLDKDSNRYLNVTFLKTRGTLIGTIYADETKRKTEMVFSVQVDGSSVRDYQTIISVPSSIESSRYVCFHPSGDKDGEHCKPFSYVAQQLQSFRVAHRWQTGTGECKGCNEFGTDSILFALNPQSWFDGLNSTTEILAFAVEVVGALALFLFFVLLCTKCFIPLAKCTVSVAKPLTFGSTKK